MFLKKEKTTNKLLTLIITVVMIMTILTSSIMTVRADVEYPFIFDRTNVMDDLRSAENFNISEYYFDPSATLKSPEIVNFVEWAYSYEEKDREDYALYIYFYNPQQVAIDEYSLSNRIQIATKYVESDGSDSSLISKDSIPSDYETFSLLFCSKSEERNYEGMFYKFRVLDHKMANGYYLKNRKYLNDRRYDVSGIVLSDTSGNVKEYSPVYERDGDLQKIGVGGTWYFSGYAKGMGQDKNDESTLKNTGFKTHETIRLEVHPTSYRSESSSLGKYHENEISSVYFSVPDRYFNEYGDLQKIKAEWFEYKTQYIFLVNSELYTEFLPWVGVNIGYNNPDLHHALFRENTPVISTAYNLPTGAGITVSDPIDTMYYLFPADDRKVSANQLEEHIRTYNKSFNKGKLQLKNQTISADLFLDEVDAGRTWGYNIKEFDANDKFDILSYDDTHSGWQRFWDYFGVWASETGGGKKDISPIEYKSISNFINLSDVSASSSLLVKESDLKDFKSFYKNAEQKNETTVLFRFAQTDYYQEGMYYGKAGEMNFGSLSNKGKNADIAQCSVFLDFKIIQLTFNKEGSYKTIPVTQNPIDIYTSLAPTEIEPWQWFERFIKQLGAWGLLIVSIVLLVIIVWLIIKLSSICTNWFGIIIYLMVILLVGVGCYFAGLWVVDTIVSLGGL